jgi:hypothetical protein
MVKGCHWRSRQKRKVPLRRASRVDTYLVRRQDWAVEVEVLPLDEVERLLIRRTDVKTQNAATEMM